MIRDQGQWEWIRNSIIEDCRKENEKLSNHIQSASVVQFQCSRMTDSKTSPLTCTRMTPSPDPDQAIWPPAGQGGGGQHTVWASRLDNTLLVRKGHKSYDL